MPVICEVVTSGPSRTQALGAGIGRRLTRGGVIALTSELGGGKTCFTRGLCSGLGIPPRQVNSPTFVLANHYRGRLAVYHLDLYRIEGVPAALDLGILDYLEAADRAVVVIEWAERIAPLLPAERLDISFSVLSARKRRIEVRGWGERFAALVAELVEEDAA